MKVIHPTHLLFMEPKHGPSEPIEDELTKMVDEIFATLKPTTSYRGCHTTPFGVNSDNRDYEHPTLPIIANSLSTYYVRYHRQDISPAEVANIQLMHKALDPDYYGLEGNHYLILHQRDPRYGKPFSNALYTGGRDMLVDTIYEVITEEAFDRLKSVGILWDDNIYELFHYHIDKNKNGYEIGA